MNVAARLQHRMDATPDETALVGADGTELTFGDVDRRARRVAAWLDERDLAGERVAVYLPDTPTYVPVVVGCWRAGAVASPINTRFGLEELEYTLSDLDPSALFAAAAFADRVDELAGRIDGLDGETTPVVDREGSFVGDDLPPAADAPGLARRLDGDPAVVMYTSGTTGHPKGVVQTHRNVGAQLDVNLVHFSLTDADVTVVAVPLFHVGGLYGGALPTLLAGATAVAQPAWDAARWAELVETHGATFSGLIPTMMVDALGTEAARERETTSLQQVVYGGSPATEDTLDAFQSTFEVDHLRNYYGQTENTGLSVTTGVGEERRTGLMGRPVHAVEHRVVEIGSEGLVDVDPGEEGELVLRGDIITPGYWDASLDSEYFTDGWLHTDDAVREDQEGRLYYVDRVDDMVLTGGENVAPSEVENALGAHPGVEAGAVFGTNHERLGEAVTAAVIGADPDLTPEALQEWWAASVDLADYKKPRRVEFVAEFPRTATQKVDKAALEERVAGG